MADIDVVVLGSGLNALGVVRALGGHGLKVVLVSRSSTAVPGYSRFVTRHVVAGEGVYDPAAILARTGMPPGRAVLFLTEELDTVACLQDLMAWKEAFRTYFHTPGVAAMLLEKAGFDELARSHGAPVPKTVVVGPGAAPAGGDDLRFPLVVKPAFRDARYDARFKKAYRVDNEPAFTGLLNELQQVPIPLVVQEWVKGEDSDIYFNLMFLDADGELCSSFVGRKVLCWPPRVGGTASCVAAPEYHDELTAITAGFLRSIRFRGLLGMEYKRDPRDGKFYMIEPTVYRTDYQHEIASLSGVEFLFQVYARLRGLAYVPRQGYNRCCYWVDNPAARYAARSQENAATPVPAARRVDAWFRVADPLPGLFHYGRWLASRLRAAVRKLHRSGDGKEKSVPNA